VHGERAGFNNTAWDAQFLDLIENDPVRISEMTQAELATLGGMEGTEVIMWLVMRGALSANVRKTHQTYYLPSMTGIATAIYENQASPPVAGEVLRHRRHMAEQSAGLEKLTGTYPFTLERSVKAYRLNKFLHGMTRPAHRARFLADGSRIRRSTAQRGGARHAAAPRLARADPLRRDLFHAGKTGRGDRRVQPAHLRRHARAVAGRLPENPQRARRAVFRRGQGCRAQSWDTATPSTKA
jgi:hypothetical protein